MSAAYDAFERWAYGEGFTAGELEGRKRGFDEGYAAGFDAGIHATVARALLASEQVSSGPTGTTHCADMPAARDETVGGQR